VAHLSSDTKFLYSTNLFATAMPSFLSVLKKWQISSHSAVHFWLPLAAEALVRRRLASWLKIKKFPRTTRKRIGSKKH
jgi:hypothetical protein